MNIFLVGNGFDLQHSFLTKYKNFLHIVQFLIENYDVQKMKTVYDVLSSSELQKDKDISKSCGVHCCAYKQTFLRRNDVESLINKAKNNLWFQYFLKALDKDLGWIDFEKEINCVIDILREAFSKITPSFLLETFFEDDIVKCDIFMDFASIFCEEGKVIIFNGKKRQTYIVFRDYCTVRNIGANFYEVNKEKIVQDLYDSLEECADILKEYLIMFVDRVTAEKVQQGERPNENMYYDSQATIISFNYTNTYEHLYCGDNAIKYDQNNPQNVIHIHGKATENIVLGVNPDKFDEIADLDTMFIQFKKYFQRVFYKTDIKHIILQKTTNRLDVKSDIHLSIIGHSLDKTDEDIIKYWIEKAKTIKIFYHEELEVGKYIKNLVTMFGKQKFDDIRQIKHLEFKPNEKITYQW